MNVLLSSLGAWAAAEAVPEVGTTFHKAQEGCQHSRPLEKHSHPKSQQFRDTPRDRERPRGTIVVRNVTEHLNGTVWKLCYVMIRQNQSSIM